MSETKSDQPGPKPARYKKYITVEGESGPGFTSVYWKTISNGEKIDMFDTPGDGLADYYYITWRMRRLLGKVLTVIDASITEKGQNKAVKDLIKGTYMEEYSDLTDILFDKTTLYPSEPSGYVEVSQDVALGLAD